MIVYKMANIESRGKVHSMEKKQTKKKTAADQYEDYHNLDYSKCDSNTWEDRGKGVVVELE